MLNFLYAANVFLVLANWFIKILPLEPMDEMEVNNYKAKIECVGPDRVE